MRASEVLHKRLAEGIADMHAARKRCVLLAGEALVAGRRLTLMDLARSWPGAGRVRGTVHLKPAAAPDTPDQWRPCKALYALATGAPCDLGPMAMVQSRPYPCRVVVYAKRALGRKDRTRHGHPARSKRSRQNAAREREPWLLAASPELAEPTAHQLVAMYARRMQIELSFRDLKSHHYGQGLEDSLTRKGPRLAILLLPHTLAAFACWLLGRACEATGLAARLAPYPRTRRFYSLLRLGSEALVRAWSLGPLRALADQLQQAPLPSFASVDLPA